MTKTSSSVLLVFLDQGDKEVYGMLDNLTVTDNEELARQVNNYTVVPRNPACRMLKHRKQWLTGPGALITARLVIRPKSWPDNEAWSMTDLITGLLVMRPSFNNWPLISSFLTAGYQGIRYCMSRYPVFRWPDIRFYHCIKDSASPWQSGYHTCYWS